MRLIRISSSKSKDEIFKAFESYLEVEKHSAFSLIDFLQGEYLSSHTGIHSYLDYERDKISGYYETGEIYGGFRGSEDSYTRIKTWFELKVCQEENSTKVQGAIFFSPWFWVFALMEMLLVIYLYISGYVAFHVFAALALLSLVIFIRFGASLKEQRYIYDLICRACE